MRSAIELSKYLGQPFQPTEEQARVIEADETPVLVVAGAGSGKTTTMADRVVWLVSEKGIRPDQILGLTFTRKATQELSLRIHAQLKKLHQVQGGAEQVTAYLSPTISTYNSFANAIFRDNALLVGREPESTLLEDSAAWALARNVVYEHGGNELSTIDIAPDSIIESVLRLSQDLAQNNVNIAELETYLAEFETILDLPRNNSNPRYANAEYPDVVKAVTSVVNTQWLLGLVEKFRETKRQRNLVEYSDQVALAYQVVTKGEHNPVRQLLRDQYRAVLLDEYQDTSVAESRLLSTIFYDHPVMAVGDPHQSIYGWRGASASNLAEFRTDFGADPNTPDYSLTTSWRNDTTILEAANQVSAPLIAGSRVPVKLLQARPGAAQGNVDINYYDTDHEEAEAVADWLSQNMFPTGDLSRSEASSAILFRRHKTMAVFAAALKNRGLPHEIVGLGGLMQTPEVVDVVAALRVLQDQHEGNSLIRLLTSGRWRVGVRDLKQLKHLATRLGKLGPDFQELPQELLDKDFGTASPDSGYTIIDALDFIDTQKSRSRFLTEFSANGLSQLQDAAAVFASLRRLQHILTIPELIQQVIEKLLLDVELNANETRFGTGNLANFRNAVQGFLASTESSTLAALLEWLERASNDTQLKQQEVQSAPGRIQLLTIHAAKGLEWDYVAIPKMAKEEFPMTPSAVSGWVGTGKLPYEFRADRADLPVLEWREQEDRVSVKGALAAFKDQNRELHYVEERRLAYVAITRARTGLFLCGSFWNGEKKKPMPPGEFFVDVLTVSDSSSLAAILKNAPEDSAENPNNVEQFARAWPYDPLGARRGAVERAANQFREYVAGLQQQGGSQTSVVLPEAKQQRLTLLIQELQHKREGKKPLPELPNRVPASAFKDFIQDPERQQQKFARPMPEKPYRATRLGTQFHTFVEEQAIRKGSQELFDSSWYELDHDDMDQADRDQEDMDQVDMDQADLHQGDSQGASETAAVSRPAVTLENLIQNLHRSEWGGLQPLSVEEEIQLPLAGKIVICKIDAVYRASAESNYRVQVVDWKTGRAPQMDSEKRDRLLQIHLYRLAYAELHNIPLHEVDAVLYYVAENVTLRAEEILGRNELEELWRKTWQK